MRMYIAKRDAYLINLLRIRESFYTNILHYIHFVKKDCY